MAGLTIAGVCKSFGGRPVLDGVDLSVASGSTVALLGPSGSGKSTLLRIVAGLERGDAGAVAVDDVDLTGVSAHRRGIGVVFQDQALFPHLDVGGNVGFGLRMAGWTAVRRRDRVAEVLTMVGLDGFEDRDPSTLSGGEAQRVALARALAPEPSVLLLDEPLAALDQLLRERLLLELRELFNDLHLTVVSVTHDPTEAAALGDRIGVLLHGRIVQIGTPGQVLSDPASAAVAGLVGHRNLVVGTVVDGVVDCAWGRFATGLATGTVDVLVPPDAVTTDPAGELSGTVTGLLYRGGSAFAVVAGADWPPIDMRAEPAWQLGDAVRLRIDPARVRVLGRTVRPGSDPAR